MRHLRGGRLVVARQCVPADVDAGREYQAIVGEARAVSERERARLGSTPVAVVRAIVMPSAAMRS
jgi:hypothetical protein